ncbi:magnesium transporter NIPA-domain-containing protein [Amylostereum chailletii]|nr:magnesium transporter NIPA-domain-containing protein [Amylostereum chailletii]
MPILASLAGIEDIQFPQLSSGTAAGISVALAGNVLISLALNLQKLAHKRLEIKRATENANGRGSARSPLESNPWNRSFPSLLNLSSVIPTPMSGPPGSEADPLISFTPATPRLAYGTIGRDGHELRDTDNNEIPDDGRGKGERKDKRGLWRIALRWERGRGRSDSDEEDQINDHGEGQESDYLKSRLWWLGFLLMNVGEVGNFISYAFAPASIVAPLGTFALIANCFFSPLLLHERFRKRDLLGITIAIIGAVTVVLSSNTSDTRLTPAGLVAAITKRPFAVFSIVYIIGAFILATLSEGRLGKKYVMIDVGLCALFGGFTVLSTKAVSTLLTTRGLLMFKEWITYPTVLVLAGTGVCQIRYLNRALMRFDSKVVIPTQFVLFNLSAILGSAILYGDFRRATFHQFVTFMYGCAATFGGVFIIAYDSASSASPPLDEERGNANNTGDDQVLGVYVGRSGLGPTGRMDMPALRSRQSTVSLVGLSPAQRLLLVHSPPRNQVSLPGSPRDGERLGSLSRRRATSWLGGESSRASRNASRESTVRRGTVEL